MVDSRWWVKCKSSKQQEGKLCNDLTSTTGSAGIEPIYAHRLTCQSLGVSATGH